MQKTTKILLIIASFVFLLAILSNTFDNDLGWHLRFGKEALEGNFQYLDSYTWTKQGEAWVNHEWGGGILFWFLYNNFGYFSLVFFTSFFLLSGFLIIIKIFKKKIETTDIIISILLFSSLEFLLVTRLAMLVVFFFAVLWWTLKKLPNKNYLFVWPLLFWLWSALHGSWILGFIVINIYIAGYIIELLFKKYKILNLKKTNWNISTLLNVISFQLLSTIAILLNPYGIKIWEEVTHYFTDNYFKQYVTEWLPSYSYPVYWIPLIIFSVCLVLIFKTWKEKKITWPELLLFLAFFYTAFQHKRNNLLLISVCLPVVVLLVDYLKGLIIIKKEKTKILELSFLIILIYLIFFNITKIHYTKNPWEDKLLLNSHAFPYEAIKFLKKETNEKKVKIFNEFGWGAYMNFAIPNALVYLDGRGTATWKDSSGEYMLKNYRNIKFEKDGLKTLSEGPSQYIILEKSETYYQKPNFLNKSIFKKQDFEKLFKAEEIQLKTDLNKSKIWQKIYEDNLAIIWKKL